jgi:hypothetical protein
MNDIYTALDDTYSWFWSQESFRYSLTYDTSPPCRVAQECEKYGMRVVFRPCKRTYLIGSGDTLYGEVPEESCSGAELAATIAELFVTGPFRSIP